MAHGKFRRFFEWAMSEWARTDSTHTGQCNCEQTWMSCNAMLRNHLSVLRRERRQPERIKMTETKNNHPTEFASLFLKGVQRAADLQKKSLDDAKHQNAEAIAAYKKGPQSVPSAPAVYA